MKVKCISDDINLDENRTLFDWANNSQLEITVGRTYCVLAITKYLENIFYYIIGDESNHYPLAFPSILFTITDPKISTYWETEWKEITDTEHLSIKDGEIISFNPWHRSGDLFYERVLNELEPEISLFTNYRDKIINE